jgi:hypothetical protein
MGLSNPSLLLSGTVQASNTPARINAGGRLGLEAGRAGAGAVAVGADAAPDPREELSGQEWAGAVDQEVRGREH